MFLSIRIGVLLTLLVHHTMVFAFNLHEVIMTAGIAADTHSVTTLVLSVVTKQIFLLVCNLLSSRWVILFVYF